MDGTAIDNPEGPPWIWYGDAALFWQLAEMDGQVLGFSLSRHVKRHVHLHALFIHPKFQNLRIGQQFMIRHWKQGILEYPEVDSFSLGVYRKNINGIRFYKKLGYQELDQSSIDPNQDNGLGDWVQNCLTFNDWPLRDGAMFFIKFASTIVPGKK